MVASGVASSPEIRLHEWYLQGPLQEAHLQGTESHPPPPSFITRALTFCHENCLFDRLSVPVTLQSTYLPGHLESTVVLGLE